MTKLITVHRDLAFDVFCFVLIINSINSTNIHKYINLSECPAKCNKSVTLLGSRIKAPVKEKRNKEDNGKRKGIKIFQ